MHRNTFFEKDFIDNILFNTEFELSSTMFIFEDMDWKSLVWFFKSMNITLSGGSTVKRHLLSTIHMRLSRFLLILEGFKPSFNNTLLSNNYNNIIHYHNSIENFSKNKDIFIIRNLIKNMEVFDNNEIDRRLYLLYKTMPYFFGKIVKRFETFNSEKKDETIKTICDLIFDNNFDQELKVRWRVSPIELEKDFYIKLKISDNHHHYNSKSKNNESKP